MLRSKKLISVHEKILATQLTYKQLSDAQLIERALNAKYDVWRIAAAEHLKDEKGLVAVALKSTYRKVLKIVFNKIEQEASLTKISKEALDQAIQVVAAQKLGVTTWAELFKESFDNSETLGNVLAAVTLLNEVSDDVQEEAEKASVELIRKGDESRIPEMSDILILYGDKQLCEDYLNCGQPDLSRACGDWAKARGLNVGTGNGSHRATWGRGR